MKVTSKIDVIVMISSHRCERTAPAQGQSCVFNVFPELEII